MKNAIATRANLAVLFATGGVVGGIGQSSASAAAVPITVTGYNQDVVYEAGATGSGFGSFSNEGKALYETAMGRGREGSGLPSNGQITSPDGTQFQLTSYAGNNALVVREDGGSKFATFTFAPGSQQEYSKISLLGLSAGGQSNFSLVVFFTDGTNTGIPEFEGNNNVRGTFDGETMPDWFGSGGTADVQVLAGVGRINNNGDGIDGDNAGGGVRLQQFDFNLSPFAGKSVSSLTFESTGGGDKNRTFLAVSGSAVPEPASLATLALGGLALIRRRRA